MDSEPVNILNDLVFNSSCIKYILRIDMIGSLALIYLEIIIII